MCRVGTIIGTLFGHIGLQSTVYIQPGDRGWRLHIHWTVITQSVWFGFLKTSWVGLNHCVTSVTAVTHVLNVSNCNYIMYNSKNSELHTGHESVQPPPYADFSLFILLLLTPRLLCSWKKATAARARHQTLIRVIIRCFLGCCGYMVVSLMRTGCNRLCLDPAAAYRIPGVVGNEV